MKKATLLLAGVSLAFATTVAFAAKPALTGKEKKELAAKVKENQKKAPAQPKTMAQAGAMKLQSATGAQGVMVATDLWPTMYVQTDANGAQHIVETEGGTVPAKTAEGLPNE